MSSLTLRTFKTLFDALTYDDQQAFLKSFDNGLVYEVWIFGISRVYESNSLEAVIDKISKDKDIREVFKGRTRVDVKDFHIRYSRYEYVHPNFAKVESLDQLTDEQWYELIGGLLEADDEYSQPLYYITHVYERL